MSEGIFKKHAKPAADPQQGSAGSLHAACTHGHTHTFALGPFAEPIGALLSSGLVQTNRCPQCGARVTFTAQ
jgi:hypothetical protein